MTIEVKHTHATSPESRVGVPYLEINAQHVIDNLRHLQLSPGQIIPLRCEQSKTPCPICEKEARARAVAELTAKEAEIRDAELDAALADASREIEAEAKRRAELAEFRKKEAEMGAKEKHRAEMAEAKAKEAEMAAKEKHRAEMAKAKAIALKFAHVDGQRTPKGLPRRPYRKGI